MIKTNIAENTYSLTKSGLKIKIQEGSIRKGADEIMIMRNCGVCADAGHAYKLAAGVIMCQVSQKFMSDTETCAYDLEDLRRKRKEARHRADRLDALYKAAAWTNTKEEV